MRPPPRFGRATQVVLGLLCAMSLITYVDRVNVATAAGSFASEFHLNNTQIGFVFSVYAYPYFLLQVLGGWFGDRFGPRRTLAVCSFIWSFATVLCGFAGGFTALIAARLLLGIGEGAALPTATRVMADWVEPRRRGFAQGLTHAWSRFGNAVTPPFVAWIILRSGWRASFLLAGAISFVWTAVWYVYFRDDPARHGAITAAELGKLTPRRPPAFLPAVPWGPLLRRLAPVAATYFCYGWVLWLYLSWLPIYFVHRHHLLLKNSALFSAGIFLAGVAGDWLGGIITDRWARQTGRLNGARSRMVALCMLVTVLSLLPLFLLPHLRLPAIALCLSLGFFFNELCIGPMWCIPMDIAPEYCGTASGVMNAGGAVAAILSPVVAGFIIDRTGNWDLPFFCSIGVTLAGAGLALTMRPESKLCVPA